MAAKVTNPAAVHFFSDRRMLFVDRRALLRERVGTAILVAAWAAAGLALLASLRSLF